MSSNRVVWLSSTDPPEAFPDISSAMREPDGLLAAGADLARDRLVYAYRKGIFPWFDDGQPVLWWSPDPRCVLVPGEYHTTSRLRRNLPSSTATLTFNTAFDEVIRACAAPRRSAQGTWITPQMIAAFNELHDSGWAHSIEVREHGDLVGGVYGIAIGKVFFGESMFSARSNASKFALLGLCQILADNDFALLDCQVVSRHLLTLGAKTIPREDFRAVLDDACGSRAPFDAWPGKPLPVRDLRPR